MCDLNTKTNGGGEPSDVVSKDLLAVRSLLEHEISEQYSVKFEVEHYYDREFEVEFSGPQSKGFNGIRVRVLEIDEDDDDDMLAYSKFAVNVYEDVYEEFTVYDSTIKELWKQILWSIN